jgi:hypothetical protein
MKSGVWRCLHCCKSKQPRTTKANRQSCADPQLKPCLRSSILSNCDSQQRKMPHSQLVLHVFFFSFYSNRRFKTHSIGGGEIGDNAHRFANLPKIILSEQLLTLNNGCGCLAGQREVTTHTPKKQDRAPVIEEQIVSTHRVFFFGFSVFFTCTCGCMFGREYCTCGY